MYKRQPHIRSGQMPHNLAHKPRHGADSLSRKTITGAVSYTHLDKEPMIGNEEEDVTYPEFHLLADGGLLFVYRSGASGRGRFV